MLKTSLVLVIIGIITSGIIFAHGSELTKISIAITGNPEIVIKEDILIRANVEIENYDPADGYYFMRIINVTDRNILNESEIQPRFIGDDIWGVQVAYMAQGDELKVGNYEIQIYTEFGTATASTNFSVVESQTEIEEEITEHPVQSEKEITLSQSETLEQTNSNVVYKDSTGYIPEWAKNSGYHSVLSRCNELIGYTTKDGNWCMEWVAYVLDQGIENFPESATGKQTQNEEIENLKTLKHERKCTVDSICVFPGEFLKTKTIFGADNTLLRSETMIVFGEIVDPNTIQFNRYGKFSDSEPWERKHLLNLKRGTNSIIDEAYHEEKFFDVYKIPLDLEQIQSTFTPSEVMEDSKEFLGKDRLVVILRALNKSGELWIDKQTGVRLYSSLIMDLGNGPLVITEELIDTNIFDVQTIMKETNSNIKNDDATEIPSKSEILTRLSDLFNRSPDSRFLLSNEEISDAGESIKTSYEIIRVKDNSLLGYLDIYGDKKVTKIEASTSYNIGKRTFDDASDILQIIRLRLIPDCCGGMINHYTMFLEHNEEEFYSLKNTIGNIEISLGWLTVDKTFGTGIFSQEITYSTNVNSGIARSELDGIQSPKLTEQSTQTDSTRLEDIQEDETSDWIYLSIAAFVLVGIPLIIIVLIIWKIKKWRESKKREFRAVTTDFNK